MKNKLLMSGVVAGLTMAGLPLFSNSGTAEAACAFAWTMENASGEEQRIDMCAGSSADGTFSSKLSDDNVISVDLKGYKGKAFTLASYGTGIPFEKIVFNLSGENEVTAEDGAAFDLAYPLEFTGEGSLKIKALLPMISGAAYTTEGNQIVTAPEILQQYMRTDVGEEAYLSEVTIKPKTVLEKPTDKPTEDETDKPEDEPEKDENAKDELEKEVESWDWPMITIHVAAGIYIVLSLITLILLGVRRIMRKHNPTTTKKIVIEEVEEPKEEKEEAKKPKSDN